MYRRRSGRDHDTIARREALRALDHLGDAFVAEVDRRDERRLPEDHGLVDVARRHRERPHDRLALVPALGIRNLVPAQPARVLEYERAHQRALHSRSMSRISGG
jgi:hypothetical protein